MKQLAFLERRVESVMPHRLVLTAVTYYAVDEGLNPSSIPCANDVAVRSIGAARLNVRSVLGQR